jgi:hypothetical protein
MWNEFWEYFRPFFVWCNGSMVGTAVRESRWAFPVTETVHMWALAVLLGAAMVMYLRMAGVAMLHQPASEVARQFGRWTVGALAVMVTTGGLLFMSEALKCFESPPFRIKMAILFPAIILHFTIYHKMKRGDESPLFSPVPGKFTAAVAATLWLGVGIAGRLISFY